MKKLIMVLMCFLTITNVNANRRPGDSVRFGGLGDSRVVSHYKEDTTVFYLAAEDWIDENNVDPRVRKLVREKIVSDLSYDWFINCVYYLKTMPVEYKKNAPECHMAKYSSEELDFFLGLLGEKYVNPATLQVLKEVGKYILAGFAAEAIKDLYKTWKEFERDSLSSQNRKLRQLLADKRRQELLRRERERYLRDLDAISRREAFDKYRDWTRPGDNYHPYRDHNPRTGSGSAYA